MRHLTCIALLVCLLGLGSLAQASEIRIFNPNDTSVTPYLTLTPLSDSSRAGAARAVLLPLDPIPPKGTYAKELDTLGGASPGGYSATLDSLDNLAAVFVNTNGEGAIQGVCPLASSGSTTLGVLDVEKTNSNQGTTLAIMNTGGAEDAQVRCGYHLYDGTLAHETMQTLAPGVTTLLGPDQPMLADGFAGSAVITSDQPVAAIKFTPPGSTGDASLPWLDDYGPIVPPVYHAYFPLVHNMNYGSHTTISQLNTSPENAVSTGVGYRNENGDLLGDQWLLDPALPFSSQTFDPLYADHSFDTGRWVSADVSSYGESDDLLGQNAEATTMYSDGSTSTYNAVQTDTTVHLPGFFNQDDSSLTLYNPGNSPATINVMIYNADGSLAMGPPPALVDAGGSQQFNLGDYVGNDFKGSVSISSNQPLAVVGNSQGEDLSYAYNGVGGTPDPYRAATVGNLLYAPYVLVNSDYTGWWWEGADYTGTGISIENQGENIYLAWYGYEDSGQAAWYSAVMSTDGAQYSGDLYRYTGWPLSENNPAAGYTATLMGPMTLDFASSSEATLSFTIGETQYTKDLTRYWSGTTDTRELNGWWYAPSHDGMGVFLEVRDGVLFGAWYHYRDDQSPRWWICLGDFAEGSTVYSGPWGEYSSGQTLTGAYQASVLEGTQGDMTLNFADESHATMTWGGNTYNLERFSFGDITLR